MKLCCVVAVAVLVVALCSQARQDVQRPNECCFRYYPKPIPVKQLKSYIITNPNCPKKGVLLITRRDKKVCANPEVQQVQIIMEKLDSQWDPEPTPSSGWDPQPTIERTNVLGPNECCFGYYTKWIPVNQLKSYIITNPNCPKKGVHLITRRDKKICANPEVQQVQIIMEKLDSQWDPEPTPSSGWDPQPTIERTNVLGPNECCFGYYTKWIPVNQLKSYIITNPNCPKKGVHLITRRDKKICANPEVQQVQIIMEKLDSQWDPEPTPSSGWDPQPTIERTNVLGPNECCFGYYTKWIPVNQLKSYIITNPNCPKKGVHLITRRDKKICANPEVQQVQIIMEKLDSQWDPEPTPSSGWDPQPTIERTTIASARPTAPDVNCCTYYSQIPLIDQIETYVLTDTICPKKVVVFTTLNGIKLCANPDESKIQNLMGEVDSKLEINYTHYGASPDHCCFQYQNDAIFSNQIESYRRTSTECSQKGIIFTTTNGTELCANPDAEHIQTVMEEVDYFNKIRFSSPTQFCVAKV